MFCAEPAEISLLYFLWYLHCGGGLQQLVGEEVRPGRARARIAIGLIAHGSGVLPKQGAAQAECFVGGSQQISERMAQSFGPNVKVVRASGVPQVGGSGVTDGGVWRA